MLEKLWKKQDVTFIFRIATEIPTTIMTKVIKLVVMIWYFKNVWNAMKNL